MKLNMKMNSSSRSKKTPSKLRVRKSPHASWVGNLIKYSSKYPWGLFRKKVVRGYFPDPEKGPVQELFFKDLLKAGFKRTPWQLILPGQTAGVVKRVPRGTKGTSQYHVRFYADGTIDCEMEYHRFHVRHWSGQMRKEKTVLEEILAELSVVPSHVKSRIVELWREAPAHPPENR